MKRKDTLCGIPEHTGAPTRAICIMQRIHQGLPTGPYIHSCEACARRAMAMMNYDLVESFDPEFVETESKEAPHA